MHFFSWRKVHGTKYTHETGVRLSSGMYAADVFDQHSVSWCGCCYIVAAVQCVEDRGFILMRKRSARSSRYYIDMQRILDHFDDLTLGPGWNACHGGFPLHVLGCMKSGACPLMTRTSKTWFGHPRNHSVSPIGDAPYRVSGGRRVDASQVRQHLLHDGPIVLEINGVTVKSTDKHGVVQDMTHRTPNHAVSVIGWTMHKRVRCWIARNSWGQFRVPRAIPDDLTCVSRDKNTCRVDWEYWVGDPSKPGFFYIPEELTALHVTTPPPWIVPTVVLKDS